MVTDSRSTGSITADPNPIEVSDGSGVGMTTLSWTSEGIKTLEVHVGAPDGPLVSRSGSSGSAATDKWVGDGTLFCLQDVSGGLPLTFANTLATVTVNVTAAEGVYPFAAYLGQRFGCTHVIGIGCGTAGKLVQFHPQFEIIGIDVARNVKLCRERYGFGTWVEWNLDQPRSIQLPDDILKRAIIVCDDVIEQLLNPTHLLENLRSLLDHSPVCIVSIPERVSVHGEDTLRYPAHSAQLRQLSLVELERLLRSRGFNLMFTGVTTRERIDYEERTIIAVIGQSTRENDALAANVPSDFRVVAIMAAYNEQDIIVPSIRRLIDHGVEVYLIDNWSTDATFDFAKQFQGQGLIGVERFPKDGPSPHFHLRGLLTRVEELAREIEADWFIHHDVDEVRLSPWSGVSLRNGLYMVDREGFNCIDHTLIEFHPVDNNFVAGSDFESYFKLFEFSRHRSHFIQIKAWKNLGQRISLAESCGHDVRFEGRRIYPYKFLLKHYPFRSQAHGERKVFLERKARWNSEERAKGFHVQYDDVREGHVFLRQSSELELFDEARFNKTHLVERLSGVGVLRHTRPSRQSVEGSDLALGTPART